MNDDRERFLYWKQNIFDIFPEYCAMPVIFTQTFINENKRARDQSIQDDCFKCELLTDKNITRVTVDFGDAGEVLQEIMKRIGHKITHVVMHAVRNAENCEEFIYALPDKSNFAYLNIEKQGAAKIYWNKYLQKMPNLTSLSVKRLDEQDMKTIAKLCPNLTKLSILNTCSSYPYGDHLEKVEKIALEKLPQLKELKLERLTDPIVSNDLQLESLTLSQEDSDFLIESLPSFTFLIKLFAKVSCFDDIIQYCHFLEEIEVYDCACQEDIEELAVEIPSLRLIYGANKHEIDAPFLGSAVDVIQLRKEIRTAKRRKVE
jgi:hypothetical protein